MMLFLLFVLSVGCPLFSEMRNERKLWGRSKLLVNRNKLLLTVIIYLNVDPLTNLNQGLNCALITIFIWELR